MSEFEPLHPYVYQPYGIVDPDESRVEAERLFGVAGVHRLATIKGLTRNEADAVVVALRALPAPQWVRVEDRLPPDDHDHRQQILAIDVDGYQETYERLTAEMCKGDALAPEITHWTIVAPPAGPDEEE